MKRAIVGIKSFLSRKTKKINEKYTKYTKNIMNRHDKIHDIHEFNEKGNFRMGWKGKNKILDDSTRRQKSVAIQVQPQMRSRDPQTHFRTQNQSTQVYIPDNRHTGSHVGSHSYESSMKEEVSFAEPQSNRERDHRDQSNRRSGSYSGEESEPPRHVRYTGTFLVVLYLLVKYDSFCMHVY